MNYDSFSFFEFSGELGIRTPETSDTVSESTIVKAD